MTAITKPSTTKKVVKSPKLPVVKVVKLKTVKAAVPVEAVITTSTTLIPIESDMYGAIEYATSMNLKRRFVKGAYYAKLFIPSDIYTDLNTVGIEHGCTWDEVIRGAVELVMRDADAYGKLENFLPINFNVPSL